jgi:hypothetical protein
MRKLALLAVAAVIGFAGLGAGHASSDAAKKPRQDAKSVDLL